MSKFLGNPDLLSSFRGNVDNSFSDVSLLKKILMFITGRYNNIDTAYLRNNGAAVFDYNFIMHLNEKDYPKYLSLAYYVKTGQKLNLRRPKLLNEKIQWLKLYDNIPIKSVLTDKVLVRDWVKEKIGEEYIKPRLWVGTDFDDIPFEELPNSFVVKANHGCKWHFTVKNKQEYLRYEQFYNSTKEYMESWLRQSFFGWSDFETQYKNIEPKIIVEPLLCEDLNKDVQEIEVWCFNGKVKFLQKITPLANSKMRTVNSFDENFNGINLSFSELDNLEFAQCDETVKRAAELSEALAKEFKLVRVDWMIYNNKLYFAEMTFTPLSGFIMFRLNHSELQLKLGSMLNLKGD